MSEVIPEDAVEAVTDALQQFALTEDRDGLQAWDAYAKVALEAAAPHMLSHERQQTADADRDARVNARTVDKLNAAVEKVLLACDAMDEGVRIQSGDQRTSSFAAKAIRAAITDALSK